MKTDFKKKVLIHICCAVCASAAIEKLKREKFSISGYFYNPNIYPPEEYLRRKNELKKIADFYKMVLIKSRYESNKWIKISNKLKNEKEGGARCSICFRIRLEKTKQEAKRQNFNFFTTTLTVSPHKNSQKILEIGEKIDNIRFLKIDFKKRDGFKKAIEKAKKLNLYRQNYCGCRASRRKV